jgi:glycosyltransferase involved in cell wall biosynthesis
VSRPKLLILVSLDADAMARDVAEHCAALRETHEILALVPRDERDRFKAAGIAVVPWRPAGIVGMAQSISKLRKIATRFGPDVVHAHGFPAVGVALGTFPASLAVRTIATFHDPLRDKELPEKLVQRKLPGYLRRAGGLSATYPSLARALERRLGVPADSIAVIPHGVALGVEPDRQFARPAGRTGPIVGWRGSLSADRSWETAIDGFKAVRARAPDARLQISGTGRARQFVAAHARQQNLADAVTFRGDVGAEEFFAGIDVLAVPLSRDAQPHAPLEGLTYGIPVVAANAGALADALAAQTTAWLVPDDAEGFAEGLEDAWSRIDAAWQGAQAQRPAARAAYGREAVTAQYLALYDAIDARGGAAETRSRGRIEA